MNTIIKEKIRTKKDEIKSLELKKQNLKDKVEMQKSFIEELENRGNANINANKRKISDLDAEVGTYMTENAKTEEDIFKYAKEHSHSYQRILRQLGAQGLHQKYHTLLSLHFLL